MSQTLPGNGDPNFGHCRDEKRGSIRCHSTRESGCCLSPARPVPLEHCEA